MTRPRTRLGILLLALLALITGMLARDPEERAEAPPERPDTRLNYALFEFRGRLLDEDGAVRLSIAAPVLRNDAESGIGTVESPEIRVQQFEDQWYITAESAIISADREQVQLIGEVFLSRRDELTDQLLEITTSDVLLHVTPRTAETEAAVRMSRSFDRLDAVGMRLDMIAKHYEFLDDVRIRYEVP